MVRIGLSRLQRGLVLGIAAVITIILWVQIKEEGFAEAPWLIGCIIIGGLLLLATSPVLQRPAQGEDNAASDRKNMGISFGNRRAVEGKEVVQKRFRALAREWESYLTGSIADRTRGLPLQLPRELTDSQSKIAALKIAYALYSLVIRGVGGADYKDNADYTELRTLALMRLFNNILRVNRSVKNSQEIDREDIKRTAMLDIAKSDLAVDKCYFAFSKKDKYPLDALYVLIESNFPLGYDSPEDRENVYGIQVKQSIGALINDVELTA